MDMEEGVIVKRMLLAIGVAASLALSACGGSSPSATKAALKAYVGSLGSTPDLQVTLTGSFTGAGATTAQKVLNVLSIGMNFSSTSGSPLSQSAGSVNLDITANISGTPFLDIRKVGDNLYFKLDASKLGTIPGVKLPASGLQAIQFAFGGRWFELPKSVLNSVVPKKDSVGASAAESATLEAKVVDAITNVIDTTHYTSTPNGYTETGTLYSLAKAVYDSLPSLTHGTGPTAKTAKGTYTLGVSVSGSNATGVSLSITAPRGSKGNATGTINATFAHASTTVSAPSGATAITPALLRQFGLGAKP
jgi:hypothetical protein